LPPIAWSWVWSGDDPEEIAEMTEEVPEQKADVDECRCGYPDHRLDVLNID
jgi:hypothetical protein